MPLYLLSTYYFEFWVKIRRKKEDKNKIKIHLVMLSTSETNFEYECQCIDGGKDEHNVGICNSVSQRVEIGLLKAKS